MPSESSKDRRHKEYLADIVGAATAVEGFVHGLTFAEYVADNKVKWAVQYGLLIASEAVIRLDDPENRDRWPAIDWRNCRGIGNVIRHNYDAISDETIWRIVHEDLPKLKAIAESAMAE